MSAAAASTINVSLPQPLVELIARKVAEGLYPSQSAVITEALRLLEERDWVWERRQQELRREISRGIEQIDHGDVTPFDADSIIEEGQRRLSARRLR